MKGGMKEKMKRREKKEGKDVFSQKCFKSSNPPDELAENVSKKQIAVGRIIPPFFRKFRI